ncbi:ABC transporter ATP-binding protein [Halapricum hydrolyticum]|uniref:ABC transporter ATP-binding protein n=1 Tax=Halapricum hydrolyticum TaxID=2979991 RepID=A0AAE3LFB5_9EURY|nr:ABC transporter ATP-binding protein [Halapricum hydrolyticum]MCU4717990.1 ABC transporter ATP-binding protein [Halapricum hydrolyticum]MCU4727155.1 ABC transporter ATP-binding protein [Halapricum hydrolyticum]
MTAIDTTDLRMEFGDVTALEDLNLTVDDGELFGLLGPNGSGKTTTIEILTGQRRPTSGSATVLGVDPVERPLDVRSRIGILPEREDPPSFLTPREYLEFAAEIRGLEDAQDRIGEWAAKLSFEDKLDTLATNLSEGERQRVMLAQAFFHEPSLVFIDEPLVNLDPILQEEVKDHLQAYCEAGNTLFLSTHFVDVAEELCTQVGILRAGQLLGTTDPRTLESEQSLLEYFLSTVEGDKPEAVPTIGR